MVTLYCHRTACRISTPSSAPGPATDAAPPDSLSPRRRLKLTPPSQKPQQRWGEHTAAEMRPVLQQPDPLRRRLETVVSRATGSSPARSYELASAHTYRQEEPGIEPVQ